MSLKDLSFLVKFYTNTILRMISINNTSLNILKDCTVLEKIQQPFKKITTVSFFSGEIGSWLK